ncbi:hypothetical protein AALP_AA6G092300 [Arabis alpina]|uniref:Uncharacterized protein n=1 Tax=Arabis alpina TaxID=50452 RepID=A0A087GN31_ARAAL|nr:hypothetical protein AALP_AA6G092300 [Arabis alpina]
MCAGPYLVSILLHLGFSNNALEWPTNFSPRPIITLRPIQWEVEGR